MSIITSPITNGTTKVHINESAQDSTSVDNYSRIIEGMASYSISPFQVLDRNGKILTFLFESEASTISISKAVNSTFRCNTCIHRAKKFFSLSDRTGPIFMNPHIMACVGEDRYKDAYVNMHKLSHAACRGKIRGIVFLSEPNLYGFTQMEGGFNHYNFKIPDDARCDPSITQKELDLQNFAVTRYIIQGQMTRVIERLVVQGIVSCNMMEAILQKVSYGNIFLPSLRWAKGILEDLATRPRPLKEMAPNAQFVFYMKHLFKGTLAPDLSSGAVCYECQTLNNNIIGLLEGAKDEKAMAALCEARLSPLNYQRPTAPATAGQVAAAMKLLPDFEISVGRVSAFPDTIPVGVTKVDASSAMSGFAAQMASAKASAKPVTFADRCIGGSLFAEVAQIKSMNDLCDFCAKYPNEKIQINSSDMTPCYFAETTLPAEFMSVPFTWSFSVGRSPSEWDINGWVNVTHIVPGWKRLSGTRYKVALFVVKGGKIPPTTVVNTFPEFLSSQYSRTCRSAYEGLKSTMKLKIPTGEPLTIGLGINTDGENTKLYRAINLKINGTEVTISHMI